MTRFNFFNTEVIINMRNFIALMMVLVIIAGCTEKTGFEKYETLVKDELNSGKE